MEDDIIKLMEHLSIEKANLFSYSMGTHIIYRILLTNPEIIISAILGRFVLTLDEKERLKNMNTTEQLVEALKAESIEQVKKPMAGAFRHFAELRQNDLLALAAV